jgi:hypothetical protein
MRQGRAQALTAGLVVLSGALALGAVLYARQKKRVPRVVYDYSDRSGFPKPAAEMRGAASAKKADIRIDVPPVAATPVKR